MYESILLYSSFIYAFILFFNDLLFRRENYDAYGVDENNAGGGDR